ncbi:hypothetical protein [Phaeodactylibacter sp.]|uniref:hypothetical protein n=1 Tax=Phaeodactylibacter sp. TaxID=1940289 RepID=UPI0025F1FFB9|nr:hypothetical protein [Phaeodactylibacter sp.]MCI4650687.1 hypothetical protein [Phaeodactylibacter sp.]MCI5091459.1 hypothetical protein [Phaeodactylibacter sp.]
MKYLLTLFAALLVVPSLFGQNGTPPPAGARGIGMGFTGLTFHDVHAVFSNAAGIANLDRTSVAAFGEQRFLLEELGVYSFAVALPTNAGTFGLGVQHFGFEGYNEQRIGLAYARPLADNLSIGGQFLALNTQIEEYGSRLALTFALGLQYQALPQLEFAAHINSPARVEEANGAFLPTVLSVGARYSPSDQVSILLEAEKDIDYPVRTKIGIEYQVADPFYLRFGAATHPATVTLGIGYQIADRLWFDVASGYHEILGFSPAGGIHYQF